MRSADLNLENLHAVLSAEKTLYFRALVRKVEDGWRVYNLYVDNLPSSRKIKPAVLDYGEFAFVFGRTSGRRVFSWLENKVISSDGQEYMIPDFQFNVREDRFPSGIERFWIKLLHPFSIYEVSHSERDAVREDYEPLIKEGLPSFPSLIEAAYYYIFGMEYRPGTRIPGTLTFCIGHRECWLEKIHLRSSSIKVEINGTKVKGARL